ncbi:hypothetical protein DFH28DRAFT_926408 [Melampsora americana]|nr:hypothetical protein DFH28DRAFT_926408 [Melampsora americana]
MPPGASNTGQMVEDDPLERMANGTPEMNASSQGNDALTPIPGDSNDPPPPTEILSDMIDSLPKRNQIPLLAEFSKKKARTSTPGLDGQDSSGIAHITPRSERISRMLPGCEDDRSLTALLTKLVSVANSAIQLPARGRMPSRIQVDVESCADILVLINAAFDRHQIDNTKKTLFHKPASSLECPTRAAAPLMTSALSHTSGNDSQIISLAEKFDVLNEKVSFLVSSIPALSGKPPQSRAPASNPDSYATRASKAPHDGATAQPPRPRASPKAGSLPLARKRTANTVTLTQLDKSKAALSDLSITQLIQGFNNAFGLNNLRDGATSPVE